LWVALALLRSRGWSGIKYHVHEIFNFLLVSHTVFVLENLTFLGLIKSLFLFLTFPWNRRNLLLGIYSSLEWNIGEYNSHVFFGDKIVAIEIVPKFGDFRVRNKKVNFFILKV
jgi:hypothetical protein